MDNVMRLRARMVNSTGAIVDENGRYLPVTEAVIRMVPYEIPTATITVLLDDVDLEVDAEIRSVPRDA